MALVDIAHFYDLTEAQVAAAAVRSAGIEVHVENAHWGQMEAYMQHAIGGFRLWVAEEDAGPARTFIEERREAWSPPERQGGIGAAAVGVGLLALLGPAGAWLALRYRRSRLPD